MERYTQGPQTEGQLLNVTIRDHEKKLADIYNEEDHHKCMEYANQWNDIMMSLNAAKIKLERMKGARPKSGKGTFQKSRKRKQNELRAIMNAKCGFEEYQRKAVRNNLACSSTSEEGVWRWRPPGNVGDPMNRVGRTGSRAGNWVPRLSKSDYKLYEQMSGFDDYDPYDFNRLPKGNKRGVINAVEKFTQNVGPSALWLQNAAREGLDEGDIISSDYESADDIPSDYQSADEMVKPIQSNRMMTPREDFPHDNELELSHRRKNINGGAKKKRGNKTKKSKRRTIRKKRTRKQK